MPRLTSQNSHITSWHWDDTYGPDLDRLCGDAAVVKVMRHQLSPSYRRHYRTLDRQLASWCASCDCSCRTDGCAVDWMQWTMKLLHTVWFIELCSAAMLNIMRGPQVWVSWRHRVNQPCSTGGWIDWYLLFLLFGFTDRSKHFYTASHIHPSNHLCGLLFGNISGIFPLAFNYPVSVPSYRH